MHVYELLAIGAYFSILFLISSFSYKKHISSNDFIIGSRSLNYWLTALAAHASDMSSWLFMGYPAAIFSQGLINCWTAIGLIICMYLNWLFIAPKIRTMTEKYGALTFSSFFESRLQDTSGMIRSLSALILLFFYTIYISAGLTGLGELMGVLFGISYKMGILIGILVVIPYVLIGGYLSLAWIDLFQGLFLMLVIVAVPLILIPELGGLSSILSELRLHNLSTSLLSDYSGSTFKTIFITTFGWGIGYFGQPHIITKFMGIKNVKELTKSKWIGMSWMTLSLLAATAIGALGVSFFKSGLANPELVFIEMVKQSFHPLLIGLILCAVLAATMNAMSSQILVLSSSITEDFYKKWTKKNRPSSHLLRVSRLSILCICLVAYVIAFKKMASIYTLVQYAWSGIGSSFGPLVILSLYSKKVNRYGAWIGIVAGGVTAGSFPYLAANFFPSLSEISPMLPGFLISALFIASVSHLTRHKVINRV